MEEEKKVECDNDKEQEHLEVEEKEKVEDNNDKDQEH